MENKLVKLCARAHVCVCASARTCVCVYERAYVCVCVQARVRVCVCVCERSHVCVCIFLPRSGTIQHVTYLKHVPLISEEYGQDGNNY